MTNRMNSIRDLPDAHSLAGGAPTCGGCGALHDIKILCDILGSNTVFINAAGCMTLLAVYPFTPFRGSWLYTAMASAPAGAQGVRDALDILRAKGRLPEDEVPQVVVLTGDGSANGMGLSATSGAMDRDLDFIYLCYDNEGYGNTGHQYSAATPLGAATATSTKGYPGCKKDLFGIWAAHKPAYLATVCGAEPLDMARKVEKLKDIRGPKMLIGLAPCPTGWHFEPSQTIAVGKLAVSCGLWPLKELVDGQLIHTKPPQQKGQRPLVEEYLREQGRFSHLFAPTRNDPVLTEIQSRVDEYWQGIV